MALFQVMAMMAEDKANSYSWAPICARILHQPERPIDSGIKQKEKYIWNSKQ